MDNNTPLSKADQDLLLHIADPDKAQYSLPDLRLSGDDEGANPDTVNVSSDETALVMACRLGRERIAYHLAQHVSVLDAPDKDNRTQLMCAIEYGNIDVANILVERGANTLAEDDHGCTATSILEEKYKDELALLTLFLKNEQTDEHNKAMDRLLSGPGLELFDMSLLDKALDSIDGESKTRKKYLDAMKTSGNWRNLGALENDDVLNEIEQLKTKFPNFSEAVDFYLRHLSLCELSIGQVIQLPPVLLSGSPGIGKTRFVSELAKLLGLKFSVIPCATTSAGWVLSGSAQAWRDAKPGNVFIELQNSTDANPFFLLDELDKMSGSDQYDSFGPLYGLLEKETAKKFVDEFIEIPIDASEINWVATANDLNAIPDPILSRFVVIDVREPSKEEMKAITQSIYADILEENYRWGHHFKNELSEEVIQQCTTLAPRKIKHILLDGCGRASRKKSANEDVCVISAADIIVDIGKGKTGIGFIS